MGEEAEAQSTEGEAVKSEETQEEAELEVVRTGEAGSQPAKKRGFGVERRINKLNARVSDARQGEAAATAEADRLREQNKLLTLALDQAKEKQERAAPPDPNDFDQGARDPRYAEALDAHTRRIAVDELEKRKADFTPAPVTDGGKLIQAQRNHYERAAALKVKDFEQTEDDVIGILGKDVVNEIIKSVPKSEVVTYYLGKNPDEAEAIKHLIDTGNAVEATLRLGSLSAELTTRPKGSSEPTPDPDVELQGSSPAAGTEGKLLQTRYNKALAESQQGGAAGQAAFRKMLEIKRQARKDGVTLNVE